VNAARTPTGLKQSPSPHIHPRDRSIFPENTVEKRVNIFVLETNPTEVELVSMQVRKVGLSASVKRAGSMDLLFAAIKESPPDCVLANFSLPRLNVGDAIEASRKVAPHLPWVIYALNGNEETAVQCMKAGASDFVLKKHFARLGAAVKDAIQKGAAVAAPKQVEESAPQREERPTPEKKNIYQRIVESSPDLIAVLNLDGRREYNNPAYAHVLEDPDILVGTDSFLDIIEEDRERIKILFKEIVKRGYGEQTVYRLMDKESDTRFIQSNSGLILNEDGDPEKVVVISRDISDLVRDQQRVENLFAATAGLGGDDFFSVLVHRVAESLVVPFVLISQVQRNKGNRVRVLASWEANSLQQEFEYDVTGCPCERVLQDGETIVHAVGIRTIFPDMNIPGASRAEGYIGTPLQGPDGRVLGHLVIVDEKPIADASRKEFLLRTMAKRAALELQRVQVPAAVQAEGKREETRVSDMEMWLRAVVDGLPSPVLMTDEQGLIVLANPALEVLCGMKAKDLIGRRAWPLVLRGGPWRHQNVEYEDTIIRPDRSKVGVGVYAVPCRRSDGKTIGTVGVFRVIHDPSSRAQ
jgi:PAS domain S-box-containing protein